MKEKPLHHGSTDKVTIIDLSKSKGYKDFGKGFYASADKRQAESFARLRKRREERNLLQSGQIKNAVVYAYCNNFVFYEDGAFEDTGLRIKVFESADLEWVKFLYANRRTKTTKHNYDIVIGPTADDATTVIMDKYELKLKRSGYTDDVYAELAAELHPENLKRQYCFCTKQALKYIKSQVRCPWEVVG